MKANHYSSYLNRKNMLIAFGFVVVIFTHANANAIGFGVYGGTSSGNANWSPSSSSSSDYGTGVEHKEYGLVLDTAVAKAKVFNYRLQIGHVEASYDGVEFSGESVINTFGFGIVRTRAMRLWLGPQIGFRQLRSKVGSMHTGHIEYGAAIGMNFHVSPSLSLTAEAGRRFFEGHVTDDNNVFSSTELKMQRNFINVGLLYHFED